LVLAYRSCAASFPPPVRKRGGKKKKRKELEKKKKEGGEGWEKKKKKKKNLDARVKFRNFLLKACLFLRPVPSIRRGGGGRGKSVWRKKEKGKKTVPQIADLEHKMNVRRARVANSSNSCLREKRKGRGGEEKGESRAGARERKRGRRLNALNLPLPHRLQIDETIR